jgi:hypothetical protein
MTLLINEFNKIQRHISVLFFFQFQLLQTFFTEYYFELIMLLSRGLAVKALTNKKNL